MRTATQAEPDHEDLQDRVAVEVGLRLEREGIQRLQRDIYDALGVDPHPGGVRKTLI